MASRERGEHSTAAATAVAKPPAEIRDSAFRRGAGDFAERQIPGPRRFGFGTSPPRRHNSAAGPAMIYERRPSPQRDTPRHGTILPPSSSTRLAMPSRPPLPPLRSDDVRVGAALADVIRSQSDVVEEQQQQLQLLQQQRLLQQVQDTPQQQHPAFSQLALVLGFELAKKVTQRHPRETDMNRLANLALDITSAAATGAGAAGAAEQNAATSRSASTTSATSAHSEASRRRSNNNFNRSPTYDTRRFGGGGRGSGGGHRARANSSPSSGASAAAAAAAADDSFVTAVSAASAISASTPLSLAAPSPQPPSSPPPAFNDDVVVDDDGGHDDPRTDATAAEEEEEDNDLIDWDGEAATEAPPSSSAFVAPLTEESAHLLD